MGEQKVYRPFEIQILDSLNCYGVTIFFLLLFLISAPFENGELHRRNSCDWICFLSFFTLNCNACSEIIDLLEKATSTFLSIKLLVYVLFTFIKINNIRISNENMSNTIFEKALLLDIFSTRWTGLIFNVNLIDSNRIWYCSELWTQLQLLLLSIRGLIDAFVGNQRCTIHNSRINNSNRHTHTPKG